MLRLDLPAELRGLEPEGPRKKTKRCGIGGRMSARQAKHKITQYNFFITKTRNLNRLTEAELQKKIFYIFLQYNQTI